jgi:hypothetical protein
MRLPAEAEGVGRVRGWLLALVDLRGWDFSFEWPFDFCFAFFMRTIKSQKSTLVIPPGGFYAFIWEIFFGPWLLGFLREWSIF